MKKILGLLAGVAVLFGALSCAQDDGVMTLSEAADAAQANSSYVQEVNSVKLSASAATVTQYKKTSVTVSGNSDFDASKVALVTASTDTSIATVALSDDTISISGVGAGTTAVVVTYDSVVVATLPITVNASDASLYTVSYFTATAEADDPVYTAELGGADGYDDAVSSTSIEAAGNSDWTLSEGYPKFGALSTSVTTPLGYVLKQEMTSIASGDEFCTYTFEVTAKKSLVLGSLDLVGANTQSGNAGFTVSYKIGTADAVTTAIQAVSGSSKWTELSFDLNAALSEDETAVITITHKATKAISKTNIVTGLRDVVLSVVDDE